MHAAVRITTNELIQLPTYDALKQAQLQASDELVIGTYNPETGVFTSDDDKLVVDFGVEQMTTIATEVVSSEVLAASDVRVLDVIEDMLLDQQYDATMTDDIVLAVQEYMQDERGNKSALALIADNAKLRGVFKFVQLVRNSDAFLTLVAENTPVEIPQKPPVQVVATGTTAQAVAEQSQAKASNSKPESVTSGLRYAATTALTESTSRPVAKNERSDQGTVASKKPAKAPKSPKSKQVRPMPTIASLEALEAMDRKALIAAMGAINDHHKTGVRANGANLAIKQAIAKYCLNTPYVEPTKPVKAPKSKSTKTPKVEPILELPEGLTWDEVKNMKYRQLQQLGKIFRSQGHEMPRLNSKGDDIRKAIANAMRSQGHDITEVAIASQGPAKDLHLPNWTEVNKQRKLEKIASEALKMNATDAQAHMQMAA